MRRIDTSPLKQLPILEIARMLGIKVRGTKAMCFTGHDKKSASLSFSPNKNDWRCYGACGLHGDGIALVMEVLGIDFKAAIEWLSSNFSVNVPSVGAVTQRKPRVIRRQPLSSIPTKLKQDGHFVGDYEIYDWLIKKCARVSGAKGVNYLASHGIPMSVANCFEVRELRDPSRAMRELVKKWGAERVYRSGLAWGSAGVPERLIWTSYALLFPAFENRAVTYIQGRLFEGKYKFMSPRGVEKPLFNTDRLSSLSAGMRIHICEGIPDAIALEAIGLAAVAVLGATSFRAEWVDLFMKFDVVLLPDGDAGGASFLATISKMFADRGKAVRHVRLPEGKDAAEIIAQIGRES